MTNEEQLASLLSLARAWGSVAYLRANPARSAPVVVPTPSASRTARDACGGCDPAIEWRTMLVASVDCETTGVDPTTDRVVEIAIATSDGREWSSLCQPGVGVPPSATAIHGIDDAMLAGAPTFAEAWAQARALGVLDGMPLAYSHPFDASMIAAELARAGMTAAAQVVTDTEFLDPLVLVRIADKFQSGKKLVDACARRSIPIVGAHRALADARATMALWLRLADEMPPGAPRGLAAYLRWQRDRREAQAADLAAYQARESQRRSA